MTEIFDNIRSFYLFQEPCPDLQAYIEFFSESDASKADLIAQQGVKTIRLFPSFTPTIWLNLGADYKISAGTRVKAVHAKTDVLLLRALTVERRISPKDHIFTIKFHPGAFETIFGLSQAKLANQIVDVGAFLSSSFISKIKKLPSFEEKVFEFEKLFLTKIRTKSKHTLPNIQLPSLVNTFKESGLNIKNADLAATLCLSEKTFYRHFIQTIGTNPKSFFGMLRAREALTAYKSNKAAFSPYDFGYYDHGHFSKDVLKFTNGTLTDWSV